MQDVGEGEAAAIFTTILSLIAVIVSLEDRITTLKRCTTNSDSIAGRIESLHWSGALLIVKLTQEG